eukprot:5646080-Pyramimonas_sp.AAC.1
MDVKGSTVDVRGLTDSSHLRRSSGEKGLWRCYRTCDFVVVGDVEASLAELVRALRIGGLGQICERWPDAT